MEPGRGGGADIGTVITARTVYPLCVGTARISHAEARRFHLLMCVILHGTEVAISALIVGSAARRRTLLLTSPPGTDSSGLASGARSAGFKRLADPCR
ncbi:MAG TPA: hypothetical protein VFB74_13270 [Kribbellaceae bacterium]|nr:hypothetical protein [Kribbellaceae bacterium]